jgi:hypothetical protein
LQNSSKYMYKNDVGPMYSQSKRKVFCFISFVRNGWIGGLQKVDNGLG